MLSLDHRKTEPKLLDNGSVTGLHPTSRINSIRRRRNTSDSTLILFLNAEHRLM